MLRTSLLLLFSFPSLALAQAPDETEAPPVVVLGAPLHAGSGIDLDVGAGVSIDLGARAFYRPYGGATNIEDDYGAIVRAGVSFR